MVEHNENIMWNMKNIMSKLFEKFLQIFVQMNLGAVVQLEYIDNIIESWMDTWLGLYVICTHPGNTTDV